MKKMTLSALSFVLVTASAVHAQNFKAENGVRVSPAAGGTFVASIRGRLGQRGAWCAAADYAEDVLGASGTTRIFVRKPLERPSGNVVFGVGPGDTTPIPVSSVAAALKAPGSNLSVDHAYQFCHDARLLRSR